MIREDFESELVRNRIPSAKIDGFLSYKGIFIQNKILKEALFKEFSELDPRPKPHLYYSSNVGDFKYSEYDKLIYRLTDKFNDMILKGVVEDKYYGRFIEETKTIKILNEIYSKVELLKKYVLKDDNLNNYKQVAKTIANSIIALSDKIHIEGLKPAILNQLLEDNSNVHIDVNYIYYPNPELDGSLMKENYSCLKGFADDVLRDELKQIALTNRKGAINASSAKSFESFFTKDNKYLPALLKSEFTTEIGKTIRIIIYVLEDRGIILKNRREMKAFIEAMQLYFERPLGTYTSINDFKVSSTCKAGKTEELLYASDIEVISKRIDSLIKTHKEK